MKRILLFLFTFALLVSCDDTTDTIGMTLVDVADTDTTYAASYPVATESVLAQDVVSRVSSGFLGRIKDPETGSYITASYMTQLRPQSEVPFPHDSLMKKKESENLWDVVTADSCLIIMYFPNCYGDSLALMQATIHEMGVPYSEDVKYTTSFDPVANNMLRNDGNEICVSKAYTVSNRLYSERGDIVPHLRINLDAPYTDKDGVTYNNYGTYLMRKYYNPDTWEEFQTQKDFNENICPGFYFEYTGGLGNLQKVSVSQLLVYYKYTQGPSAKDTIIDGFTSFAGTEEVVQRTYIQQDKSKIQQMVEDASCTYLKSPSGIFTQATLPVLDVMKDHENDTLSTARLFISNINDKTTSDFVWDVPESVLLLPTDSLEAFFDNYQVADSRYSYLASFASTSNGYTYGNISTLITDMYRKYKMYGSNKELYKTDYKKKNPSKSDADAEAAWEKYLKVWNKVSLVPVEPTYTTLSSSSSKILTKVAHDMDIQSARLVRGTNQADSKIQLKVLYSKFNSR